MKERKKLQRKKKESLEKKRKNSNIIQYLKAYQERMLKKHLLIFVLGLVIFLIAFSIGMSVIDFNAPFSTDITVLANIKLLHYGFLLALVASFLLAMIPFIKKLSILTIFYTYYLGFLIANMFYLPTCNQSLLSISVVLTVFTLSLAIVFSFEISERVRDKFQKKLKYQNENLDKKSEKKEEITKVQVNYKFLLVTFVLLMIFSMINMILIKLI